MVNAIAHTGKGTFQSTLPTRGSDAEADAGRYIHAGRFQSTLPTRGSDQRRIDYAHGAVCFNPRSPRGGATGGRPKKATESEVSIHAPHEGERQTLTIEQQAQASFNPRSPRGGATAAAVGRELDVFVSIHAPHEGERPGEIIEKQQDNAFQSTLPTRGSDADLRRGTVTVNVSIHAPHEGERRFTRGRRGNCKSFNPRSPRGGATPSMSTKPNTVDKFQSTLPTRGSDYAFVPCADCRGGVSIHAPHEGERLCTQSAFRPACDVSIHAPHEGERPEIAQVNGEGGAFQSTLPTRGSDAACCSTRIVPALFQSTLPTRGSDR